MNRVVVGLCVFFMAGDALAGSPIGGITWLGRLETAEGPVDGTVSASFQVVTGTGTVITEVIEPSLPVVEGDFVVDLLVLEATDPLFVVATINGSRLEPNLPLALTWPSSHFAQQADDVDVALTAGQIGGITRPLTRSRLETDVDVPLAVVTGFPPAFADGDQGLAFTAGATIDLNGGVIGIKSGSLPGTALGGTPVVADLADGTIATVDLAAGGVTAGDLSSLPLTKVANGTLTSRHFGTAGLRLFEVTEPNCRSNFVSQVLEDETCNFTGTTTCTVRIGNVSTTGHVPCAAQNRPNDCFVGSTSPCPNSPAGVLVFR
jgi:hypothetical protein